MIQVHQTPRFIRNLYPSLTWNRNPSEEIFLTFDDGPHPEITPWVLEQLKRFDARASFFCVGENIEKYPDVVREVLDKAHLIANHTHHHLKGWKSNDTDYLDDVFACQQAINKFGEGGKMLFRPPYGRIKKSQIDLLNEYEIIMWSHLSWDFDQRLNVKRALSSLKNVTQGSIVVFHDSEKAFSNLKKLLPELLKYWSEMKLRMNVL